MNNFDYYWNKHKIHFSHETLNSTCIMQETFWKFNLIRQEIYQKSKLWRVNQWYTKGLKQMISKLVRNGHCYDNPPHCIRYCKCVLKYDIRITKSLILIWNWNTKSKNVTPRILINIFKLELVSENYLTLLKSEMSQS